MDSTEKTELRKMYFKQFFLFQEHGDFKGAEVNIRKRLLVFFNREIEIFEERKTHHFFSRILRSKSLNIMAYQPLKSEIPILNLLEDLHCEFFTPEIKGKNLIPRDIRSGAKKNVNHMDFIIVPGLFVTENGFRLGRGGGYYDRLLCNYPVEKTVFVGYEWQILKDIPVDAWDKPVGYIITENRFIKCF